MNGGIVKAARIKRCSSSHFQVLILVHVQDRPVHGGTSIQFH